MECVNCIDEYDYLHVENGYMNVPDVAMITMFYCSQCRFNSPPTLIRLLSIDQLTVILVSGALLTTQLCSMRLLPK